MRDPEYVVVLSGLKLADARKIRAILAKGGIDARIPGDTHPKAKKIDPAAPRDHMLEVPAQKTALAILLLKEMKREVTEANELDSWLKIHGDVVDAPPDHDPSTDGPSPGSGRDDDADH